jgi:hypothetical protein
VRCHRRQRLVTQPGVEDKPLILQPRLQLLQHCPLGRLRVATEPGFNKLQILQNQISLGFVPCQNSIRFQQRFIPHDFDLGMGFLVRFDQLVGLIQARVFKVVPAQFDVRDAE